MQREPRERPPCNHAVDSTAMCTVCNPIISAVETTLGGMSDDISMNAKIMAVGSTYAGLGYLVSKGRDFSRNIFKFAIRNHF